MSALVHEYATRANLEGVNESGGPEQAAKTRSI